MVKHYVFYKKEPEYLLRFLLISVNLFADITLL